ncbi:MAG: GNAT family N-acetyltransferase [Bacteroidales bacterium]|nr:GNAT family N-acetyltransferase [Bacteroidales bacterium]
MMEKQNLRISLRALEPSDVDILYDWENNCDIWFISSTLRPYSKYILKKYVENSHLDIYETRQLRMMIDLIEDNKKRTVGSVDLFDFDPFHLRSGVGILIAETKDRNRGIATLALIEIINYAFNILKLNQLYCNIAVKNKISLKLFKNMGFIVTGTKKQWLKTNEGYDDEYFLQLINYFK